MDDEPNLLDAFKRQLRREFSVETGVGATNGMVTLGRAGPFDVIVSDFLMPGINGAEFLAMVRKAAPLATRVLLTGHASLEGAAATVNEGQVFRILLKPVDTEVMVNTLHECVAHHRRLVSERELLEQTLTGSVKALTDVLSLASPTGFGRATRMRRLATRLLDKIEVDERWPIELAAMLSQLGVITLPPVVLAKVEAGEPLSEAEHAMIDQMPDVAESLLSPIPRMAPVVEAIRFSRRGYDGSGPPQEAAAAGEGIPLGGRILRLVEDFDELTASGMGSTEAQFQLENRSGRDYDPRLLDALGSVLNDDDGAEVRPALIADLTPGTVLGAPVRTRSRKLLLAAGQEITPSLIIRLRNLAATDDPVAEPLIIRT
ncbi:HD domain-containing phosphohydrolase [Dactylosporangium sp. CA-092794]|uniref:HD domain-containing phosphohydrolase n=1 Tax=Dactylosporangium sp. CA-092794 TaxID=3239929 RepID=UPI003D8ABFEB